MASDAQTAQSGGLVDAKRFTLVGAFLAPGEPGVDGHLLDYQTQEFVTSMWRRYIGAVHDGLDFSHIQPVMRRVSYSLEREALPGEKLVCGIRMAGRSRRSCTFEGVLSHGFDGPPIHLAQMVTVFVDTASRMAVQVPPAFWSAVERFEGRSIPVAESPVR